MTKSIEFSRIDGSVVAPSSKSVAQRAIVAALLSQGTTVLQHLMLCNDTKAALQVAETLSAAIVSDGTTYNITSHFVDKKTTPQSIFCGESGLLVRMISPVIALLEQPVLICGTGSLLTRPLNMIADALQQFGAKISSEQGKLPLSIQGKMRGGTAHIDGSSGSQLLTGLLMALPLADDDSTIYVQQLTSKPYIDLTINLLSHFGIVIAHENYEVFHIQGGQRYQPCTYNIEGDWSGASCLLVAGCIAGKVSVSNLDVRSRQADTAIVDAIKKAGGEVEIRNDTSLQTVTTTQSPLHAFEFDATNCPDLLVINVSKFQVSKFQSTPALRAPPPAGDSAPLHHST
ncbi:hypothetical protein FACS189456_5690 [Bacteroidia bacterium]|nr:hypothetical protein FACS189456_5690 [Bacteroidia bacterium]